MVPIFVINITSATDRWANISGQLQHLENHVHRFEAVNGRASEHELFRHYAPKLRVARKGAPLSPGQLGCFASHYLVWERCIELDQPIIVLEDDVTILEPEFSRFLSLSRTLNPKFECIRLFENKSKNHKAIPVQDDSGLGLVKYTKGPMSAMGYYLTPLAAKKFVENASPWFLAVDMYMDRFWMNGVECYGLEKPAVCHEYIFESMIGYEMERPRRPNAMRMKREWFAMREGTLRFLHNLRFVLKQSVLRN